MHQYQKRIIANVADIEKLSEGHNFMILECMLLKWKDKNTQRKLILSKVKIQE